MTSIVLIEDPLKTKNKSYLEEILKLSKGYKYLCAAQTPPSWKNVGVPSNKEFSAGENLPGGKIGRKTYLVSEIRNHYDNLSRN